MEEEEEEDEEEEEEEEDGSIRSSISIYVVLLSYNDFTQHNTVCCTHRVRDECTQHIYQNTNWYQKKHRPPAPPPLR